MVFFFFFWNANYADSLAEFVRYHNFIFHNPYCRLYASSKTLLYNFILTRSQISDDFEWFLQLKIIINMCKTHKHNLFRHFEHSVAINVIFFFVSKFLWRKVFTMRTRNLCVSFSEIFSGILLKLFVLLGKQVFAIRRSWCKCLHWNLVLIEIPEKNIDIIY